MKEIIYYIVIFGIFGINIAELYLSRKEDDNCYKTVFFKYKNVFFKKLRYCLL